MVRVGRDLDLDKAAADATFAWDDLLPMVKHFYRATVRELPHRRITSPH